MSAILSGMVEGVLVVDGEGRLRLANDAARRMLNLESNLLGRHYVEAVRQPGVVGQLRAALKGEHRPPIEVPLDAVTRRRRAAHFSRAGHPCKRRWRRRRARAARHQRSAACRSRAARFRGECLARAAHAADSRARVRRSADGRAHRARAAAEVPRSHRSPHGTNGAPGPRPAAAGASRRSTGNGRRARHRRRDAPSIGDRRLVRTDRAAEARRSTSRSTPPQPSSRPTRRRCTTRCAI